MQADGSRRKTKMACYGLLIRGSGGAENHDGDIPEVAARSIIIISRTVIWMQRQGAADIRRQ